MPMKKIKVDMLCMVLLLIFTTVASSHATDCSPPIKNVTCVCSNISLSCHGIQDDYLDIVELVTNISDSYPLEKNFSVDVTIKNIVLNPNSSFTNVTFRSLKLSSGLSDLPDSLLSGVVDCLHVLNLKSNNFDRVPSGALMTLKQLRTLDLSHNNISTLSKNDFTGLDNLRTLNLEHNIVSVIEPEVFSNLPLLQVLHLDHNVLVFLNSSAFKGLLNLNQLSISANVFDSLKSESFTMLSSLKILYADRNSLMDLENIHLDSVTLRELSVRQCAIHGPLKTDSLRSLPGLTSADFSYNNLTEVQSFALAASFQLKHLNLSYNSIRTLGKDAFSSLFNLITLDMRYNEILVVPESAFYNLTRLKYLNLNSNDLRAFLCPYTVDLVSLESMHLENNKIKVIRSGAFIYSQNLTELKLSGNELNCSCYMHDFSTYLLNRTSYWKEDISVIKCSSPRSPNGESVINVDYISMKCRSELPCESRIFGDVYEDDDEEDEEESTAITLSINDTSFTASENFSAVSSLNGHSTMSDNETSFSVPLTSSTDHVDIVTENITSIPPNTTAVQSNDSTKLKSTVSPFSSTSMYDDPIDIKNFSLVGKKLCIEWSVNQRILGTYSRCLLSYPPGHMQPVLRRYIKCPSPSNGTSDECVKIKASVISELCIQLINSFLKAGAKHCVSDNETLSVPLTSSTDNNTVVSTASSISLGSSAVATSHSTTSITLGITNVTDTFFPQEETSSTSSGTNFSSGSVSNFTILDPISSVTSLLTQTSTPELTTKITNSVSEQVTSESTEFSSSISGPSSATKPPYVSAGSETSTLNETDFISTATSYSTTSTTLGVTNVTNTFFSQEETSSTSSGTNFSSGSVSNFTILDPISSVTSLLTQTSTPELTTKITNSVSEQVTSESTEFSSSIGGPSSATEPPYVSAGSETSTLNETDFISTATSYSATSTTLGVTNVTNTFFSQEETSSTSSGTNFSSGNVSNFTILDPISSVTSLLTQTSIPELTTKITNSISQHVTSESTEFSSSISGPSSATEPPYVSAGSETSTLNETDFISTATSTTLGVTNVTNTFFSQEETSSTSSITNFYSGSVSNFTILDPISSVTSLLTQTSTPELTTKITNSVSEQVTSESTEFSSSIGGPSSATKAPYVSAGNKTSTSNEIDFISTATSYSTTSTTLGVTNVTNTFFSQEETSSTSSGTNFSSGSVSNFTILDPISSVTSLLTQTSTPELTTQITNSVSEQVTSESTEFSSSISGPSSATKPPYVSAGSETSTLNETDFISTATFSSDPLSTASAKSDPSGSTSAEAIVSTNSMFTFDPENFSSLLPNTTTVLSNGSTASELTVSPLSSTTVYNYPIDVKQFSVIDKKLCIEWSINQRILSNVRHCLLSYTLRNMKPAHYIRCPLSNGTSEQCLKVKAAVISELCIQLINSSNQVFAVYCTHEHYIDHPPTSSSGSVSTPFNITHLSVLGVGDSISVEWTVNREEPSATCSLKLNIESNNSVTEEQAFECTNNSYMINSTEDNVVYEICLTSDHSADASVITCKEYHVTKAITTEGREVKSAHYYSYAVLIGLLVLVIFFIALFAVRAIFQKRRACVEYNVSGAEMSVSIRKRSEYQAVNQDHNSRYPNSTSEEMSFL